MSAPTFRHGTPPSTAVVIVNLGTPEAPTKEALRRYLREFLSDRRVVDLPRAIWLPILHGIILNTRPAKSAAKYASIWTPEGSPLAVHTERQAKLLKGSLGERGHHVLVRHAMRYGEPSIPTVLDELAGLNATRILLLPLYPQYAASTSATVADAAFRHLLGYRNQPELRTVRAFCDDPGYIASCVAQIREHWIKHGEPDRLLLSFHGLPKVLLERGDPYYCECQKSGRLIAEGLGIADERLAITFQSRFGRAEWLQPYTAETLKSWGKDGLNRVDVFCPGFVGDCLETLEEIALEAKSDFLAAGGKTFHYISCLNERADWISALADLAERALGGWPTKASIPADAMSRQAARAKALGARNLVS
ncbi:MAG TPA: ferrochelatase [Rhodocyclaceae bacterium]